MHYCSATHLEQKMKLLSINLIDITLSFAKLSFFYIIYHFNHFEMYYRERHNHCLCGEVTRGLVW